MIRYNETHVVVYFYVYPRVICTSQVILIYAYVWSMHVCERTRDVLYTVLYYTGKFNPFNNIFIYVNIL